MSESTLAGDKVTIIKPSSGWQIIDFKGTQEI